MTLENAALLKVNALQTAILTSDTFSLIATDEHGIIQVFNRGAERMLGYFASDVINLMQPGMMFAPEDVAKRASALSSEFDILIAPGFEALTYKASRGIEDVFEMTYVRRDGSRLPAVVSITALYGAQGVLIGYLLIGTDNSERKRVETALKEAMSAAETASNAKTDFLARMSHELRTPLNAILGFAQLIDSGKPKPTPSQQQSVDQVLKAGWFLLDLINEVLDLTLVESGQLVLSNEPISVAEIMSECQAMMAPQAAAYDIRMTFTKPEQVHYLFADRVRFKQVMINLLMNGIKYNHRGGVVLVDCSVEPEDKLRIYVRDSGEGMTQSQLAQLFQPFNRLGKEGSCGEGTGIGLVVTKRLIAMMGGQIGVESAPGTGSVFWIELALSAAPNYDFENDAAYQRTVICETDRLQHHTVLYVEDNPANLALVEQLIARREDVYFLAAADASIGIAIARSHIPDVVLMDINLPGLSGMDAMRILRADPRTAHIPIIALSANAVPRDIQKGIAAGFLDYVTKPIRVSTFMHALDSALALSRATDDEPKKMEMET